jgi:class 3 adenylate cyclase
LEKRLGAALEMLELLAAFNRQQVALKKPQIKIGVGIATGSVVAGFTGIQNRVTYT